MFGRVHANTSNRIKYGTAPVPVGITVANSAVIIDVSVSIRRSGTTLICLSKASQGRVKPSGAIARQPTITVVALPGIDKIGRPRICARRIVPQFPEGQIMLLPHYKLGTCSRLVTPVQRCSHTIRRAATSNQESDDFSSPAPSHIHHKKSAYPLDCFQNKADQIE